MREAENIWRGGTSEVPRGGGGGSQGEPRAIRLVKRTTQQLGIIIRRYRGILFGRLYQVRHPVSGTLSLELELTKQQRHLAPDVGVEVVISAHPATDDSAPRLSMRLAQSTAGASHADVARCVEGTLSLSKAMFQVATTRSHLADTMAHLRALPERRGPVLRSRPFIRRARRSLRRAWRNSGTAATVALALVGAVLAGSYLVPPPEMPPSPMPEWSGGVPAGWMVPVSMAPVRLALDLPPRPFPDQKTRNCDEDQAEVKINGGCWVGTDRAPPCGEKMYEHKGKCYRPVGKEKEPARAFMR